MKRHLILLPALALIPLAAGCNTSHKSVVQPASMVAPPPEQVAQAQRNTGSLFSDSEADLLFSDNRARRVGDIVVVNIVESSTGESTADTTADRESTINLGVSSFFDRTQLGGVPIGTTPFVNTSATTEFEGEGETTRENQVSATIGARVVRELPGNVLEVQGAREIRVNEETQIIVVKGLVRQRDIGPDNTIASTRLADARIEYFGKGILADKQKPGWVAQILDNIWPF